MIFRKISQNFMKSSLNFCKISQISANSLWHVRSWCQWCPTRAWCWLLIYYWSKVLTDEQQTDLFNPISSSGAFSPGELKTKQIQLELFLTKNICRLLTPSCHWCLPPPHTPHTPHPQLPLTYRKFTHTICSSSLLYISIKFHENIVNGFQAMEDIKLTLLNFRGR